MLRKALDEDRTRTHVVEISPLGLVEMTRQNVSEGVREIMNKTCPTCEGEGVVRSEETIAIDVERRLRKLVKESKSEAFLVQVHPRVAAILIGGGGKPLRELEEETGQGTSTSTAPRAARWTPSRSPRRAPARRSSTAPCRSARARRS